MLDQQPLAVIQDETVLDEVLRIAAAAGCDLQVAPDPAGAGTALTKAPLVLADVAALDGWPQVPSRVGAVLVCLGSPPESCWRRVYAAGIEQVLSLPAEEDALLTLFAEVTDGPSVGDGRVLGVIGGRGGAGASVLSAAIAVQAARAGDDALLVDCDQLGGGADLLLGAEHDAGLRWPDLDVRGGRVAMPSLRDALPELRCGPGSLVMLSCGRDGPGPTAEGVAAVAEAGVRGGHTVVCDLPRELDPAGLAAVDRADLLVVVLPKEVRAVASAKRVVDQVVGRAREVALVVRGPAPGGLTAIDAADVVGLPLLTSMRPEPQLAKSVERGGFLPRRHGPLAIAADAVLDVLWRLGSVQEAA